ncbi:hypothetical protein LEP1GSC123_1072 [Leptospira borgpetersenii str. 200701203]|uniref:Uncharacterized protein n=1 Tax=Leptospira borgpetersenii str. 200701203 TaxID=1193007 RepID=M3F8B5_LEPBO|nr:hypothetical protein LEP1GSC123_1072 [Leptospira borgpetersenii str. 200701203]
MNFVYTLLTDMCSPKNRYVRLVQFKRFNRFRAGDVFLCSDFILLLSAAFTIPKAIYGINIRE